MSLSNIIYLDGAELADANRLDYRTVRSADLHQKETGDLDHVLWSELER